MITKEKAEILGLLCSEGTHCCKYIPVETKFDKKRGKYYTYVRGREMIAFGNLNKLLLKHFQDLLLKVYKYPTKITGVPTSLKINITKNCIINDLLRYTDFGYAKWKIPEEIMNGSSGVKAAFIRGLYEGDGTKLQFSWKPYIDFHMKNHEALKQLHSLLKSLGINSRFWKSDYGRLAVYGLDDVKKFGKVTKPLYKRIEI
jgi:intein/homing endonuclease